MSEEKTTAEMIEFAEREARHIEYHGTKECETESRYVKMYRSIAARLATLQAERDRLAEIVKAAIAGIAPHALAALAAKEQTNEEGK